MNKLEQAIRIMAAELQSADARRQVEALLDTPEPTKTKPRTRKAAHAKR